MKKTAIVALVAFVVVAVGIIAYGYSRPKTAQTPSLPATAGTPAVTAPTESNSAPVETAKIVTASELAAHSNESDCWMAVAGSVYDVTAYLPNHPAGPEAIAPYCGKDGTEAFLTKGGNGEHSDKAKEMLATMLVGNLAAN